MEIEWIPRLSALLVLALAACEAGDVPEGIVFLDPKAEELAGLWTGSEEITGTGDVASNFGRGDRNEAGFSFPVSLVLRVDRTFVLRSFNFPTSGNGEAERLCEGVFRARDRTLEFFPNTACRALPLNRYTIGRFFPDGLLLEARTGAALPVSGAEEVGDIRVRIRVERD